MFLLGVVSHWIHVFTGTFWFGGSMFANAIVGPALSGSSPPAQSEVGSRIGNRAPKIMRTMAALAIVTGIVNGTVFGPVKSLDVLFGGSYGLTWLAALVLGVGTALWGQLVTVRLRAAVALSLAAERPAAIKKVLRAAGVELFGFLTVFTCMILMRFGL